MKYLTLAIILLFIFNTSLLKAQAVTPPNQVLQTYAQGIIYYDWSSAGNWAPWGKLYFTADSSAYTMKIRPRDQEKLEIRDKSGQFYVYEANPNAGIVANPAEIKQFNSTAPKFTYSPTTETQQISGFNCKKIIATDTKTKETYDVWVTNDVKVPLTAIPIFYAGISGLPVRYTVLNSGMKQTFTIHNISSEKVPAGIFSIPANLMKIPLSQAGSSVYQYFR